MAEIGPFRIDAPLGRGGMGAVLRATHEPSGLPVAVKVVDPAYASRASFQEAFRNEVRAVAGLDHPHVVRVYDLGAAGVALPDVGIDAGAPYLAMELASDGTLADWGPRLAWDGVAEVVRAVLLALAHAHARGVVHRDLKPPNVLRCGLSDPRPGWKLADFGIAHALDAEREGMTERASGTPRYMAPEQIQGRWRDYGPWTDVYALGCLVWELATGLAPFGGTGPELRRAHVLEDPPRLSPRMGVPADLEAWALRCLAKSPEARWQTAADALHAFVALGAPIDGLAPAGPGAAGVAATVTADASVWDGVPEVFSSRAPDPAPIRAAPLPPRAEELVPDDVLALVRREVHTLRGAGLGLWGLRTLPLVGRDAERERLWERLLEVDRTGKAAAVVISGPAGVGKSRLAAWLAERAAERGCPVLRATHSPEEGPGDGLGPLLARALRVERLPRAPALRRIGELLGRRALVADDPFAAALADLAVPDPSPEVRRPAAARYAALARWVGLLGRTAVIWLDDVQWGPDALGFARWIVGRDVPALLVLTARDEALVGRAAEAEAIGRLAAGRVAIAPLDPARRRELVERWLGLEGDLAHRVEERSAGNPLFAVQLVGDWVRRGVLVPAAGGFRVREGAHVELPGDLAAIWAARVGRIAGPAEREALGIAAILGQDVDAEEWRLALAHAGVQAAPELVDALLTDRLATGDGRKGWSFVHGMLREAILASAPADRLPAWHRAAAAALEGREGPWMAERRGRHLLAAGEPEEAVPLLFTAARERQHRGDTRGALRLHDDREAALRALGVPDDDERWGLGWFQRAGLDRNRGRLEEAAAWCDLIVARRDRWPKLAAHALVSRAGISAARARLAEAIADARSAEALFRAAGDDHGLARAGLVLAEALSQRGALDEAATWAAFAAERFPTAIGAAEAHRLLASVKIRAGRLDEAEPLLDEALRRFEAAGDPTGLGNVQNDRAVVAHLRGDLHRAAEGYVAASRTLRGAGADGDAVNAELNAAVALARTGRAEAADALAARLETELIGMGRPALAAWAALVRAAVAAEADRLDVPAIRAALEALDAGDQADPDLVALAEPVLAAARRLGEADAAALLEAWSARQRARLGG